MRTEGTLCCVEGIREEEEEERDREEDADRQMHATNIECGHCRWQSLFR